MLALSPTGSGMLTPRERWTSRTLDIYWGFVPAHDRDPADTVALEAVHRTCAAAWSVRLAAVVVLPVS